MIPSEAMEAAHRAWREQAAQEGSVFEYNLRAALEAAAPHIQAALAEPGSAMQEAMRLAWEQGWANARANYLALHQGQEIPEWVTLRNPYGDAK